MAQIEASALTTFDVHPDGTHVRINVRDPSGSPASLVLPVTCANQLMMVLPRLVELAMRNNHKNEAVRLVHALESVYIESGEVAENGAPHFVLTADAGNGFWMSFNLSAEMLNTLASTIINEVLGGNAPAAATTH
jgi:hypothetical protein